MFNLFFLMLRHTPVLAQETYNNLPVHMKKYFDGTFWHGGHVEYILSHLEQDHPNQTKDIKVIACDIDKTVQNKGIEFTTQWKNQITPILSSYANINEIGKQYGPFDFMLLDLGVNMEHFKDGERGFSIKNNAPLDMRFNRENQISAKDIINKYSLEQLTNILIRYGDYNQKSAEYLAKGIIEARKKDLIETTQQLKDILFNLRCNQKKIAVIFQVLRIETNKELEQLEVFLTNFGEQLNKGGRCAIMTYHSIEDRITKTAFKTLAENWNFKLVNKKVIQPHYKEVEKNKAARSAKLRIIEKL